MSDEKTVKSVSGRMLDWYLLKRIYGLATPYRWFLLLATVFTLIAAITGPVIPILIQKALDEKVAANDLKGLGNMALLILGMNIFNTLITLVKTYVSADIAQRVVKDMRLKVYDYISRLKLKVIDRTPVGTLVTRNVSDIQTIADFFTEGAVTIAGDLLSILVIISLMFYQDWKLTLVSLSVLPFLLISAYVFKEKVKKSFQLVRTQVSKLNAFVQEHITGMQIVQIFNREAVEMDRFKKINKDHRNAHVRSVLYYAVFFPVVEVITAMSIGLIVWYGINNIIETQAVDISENKLKFGTLVMFIMYINMFFRPIRQLADRFNSMQMGMVAAERVFKLIDDDGNTEKSGNYRPERLKGDVAFHHAWFAYTGEDWVLKDLSLEVKEGQTFALVGATGAGKSSIINLINRFYDIQKGEILLDGIPVKEYDLPFLRQNIAVVLQDVFLFSGSIKDNIRLYNAAITDEQIVAACKAVGAHPFIQNLPGGYDYNVMERGSSLSVGQRQLISFARALAFDPAILILDEATSSIDSETEEIIQDAIKLLMKGRTSIVIAHRLSTIQHADEIIVLDKGRIVEKGDHRELLQQKGAYEKLYRYQFEHAII